MQGPQPTSAMPVNASKQRPKAMSLRDRFCKTAPTLLLHTLPDMPISGFPRGKVVIPGGTGQVGALAAKHWLALGYEVVVLTRGGASEARVVRWDGKTLDDAWVKEINGADVVLNLAGRSVSCRYTEENLAEMLNSRVDSTRVVGEAIALAKNPPKLWMQMSTATIYAHRFDAANDEETGIIGGNEEGVPAYWKRSIHIATEWERVQNEANTPHTRKVALRTAMVMSEAGKLATTDNIFAVLSQITRLGLGGAIGGGKQYVSWIHGSDFVRACDFILAHEEITGPINLAAPEPLPHRDFMRELREAWGVRVGLPATGWMASVGSFFMRTDPELVLKSRRVIPTRLLKAGFVFEHPTWAETAQEPGCAVSVLVSL